MSKPCACLTRLPQGASLLTAELCSQFPALGSSHYGVNQPYSDTSACDTSQSAFSTALKSPQEFKHPTGSGIRQAGKEFPFRKASHSRISKQYQKSFRIPELLRLEKISRIIQSNLCLIPILTSAQSATSGFPRSQRSCDVGHSKESKDGLNLQGISLPVGSETVGTLGKLQEPAQICRAALCSSGTAAKIWKCCLSLDIKLRINTNSLCWEFMTNSGIPFPWSSEFHKFWWDSTSFLIPMAQGTLRKEWQVEISSI